MAVEAIEAYPPTSAKPPLLLLRAEAYKAARQTARAAKIIKFFSANIRSPMRPKPAGTVLPSLIKSLGKEYPYPGVELQEQRAQDFLMRAKWKEARAEFEKLQGMLHEPENPHRQLAQLRIAQSRVQLKGPSSLVASLALTDFDCRCRAALRAFSDLSHQKKEKAKCLRRSIR